MDRKGKGGEEMSKRDEGKRGKFASEGKEWIVRNERREDLKVGRRGSKRKRGKRGRKWRRRGKIGEGAERTRPIRRDQKK